MPTFGSLFAGIGGIDLGLERAGWECRWQVEIDPFCQRVLQKHWPDVPRFGDVKELTGDELEPVDLIAGGFPCQPVSHAGRRRGTEDERWLWPEFERMLRMVRPPFVLVENVPGLLHRGMGAVLGGLASLGYDAEWDRIPAAAVGAPHLRLRIWIVAYGQGNTSRSDSDRLRSHRASSHPEGQGSSVQSRDEQERVAGSVGTAVADAISNRLEGIFQGRPEEGSALRDSSWWATEPDVGRVAYGIPSRVDRLRGLGNAVVPQVAEWIGRRLMEAM